MNENDLNRNKVYDAFKMIFAIMIFFSHCSFLQSTPLSRTYETILHNGRFGVCFFFMVSGYCLYKSNEKKLIHFIPSIRFAVKHIKSIYVLYLFTNFLAALYRLINGASIIDIIKEICLTSIMVQTITIKHGYALNSVGWFLSTLFFLYILSPVMIGTIRKINSNIALCFWGSILVCITPVYDYIVRCLLSVYNDNVIINGLNDVFPIYWIACYMLGMLLNKIDKGDLKNDRAEFIVIIFSLFLYLLGLNCKRVYYYRTGVYIFSNAILIWIFADEKGIISKTISGIGNLGRKLSSEFFLIHYVVIMMGDQLINKIFFEYKDSAIIGCAKVCAFLFITFVSCEIWNRIKYRIDQYYNAI